MLYKLSNRRPIAAVSVKVPRELYDRIRDTLEKSKLQSMSEAAGMLYNELISTVVVQENKIEDLNKKIEELNKKIEELTKENEENEEYIQTLEGIVEEEEKEKAKEVLKK